MPAVIRHGERPRMELILDVTCLIITTHVIFLITELNNKIIKMDSLPVHSLCIVPYFVGALDFFVLFLCIQFTDLQLEKKIVYSC